MRIAIQTPEFLYGNLDRNYNGYAAEFVRLFQPVIYLPGFRNWGTRGGLFRYRLKTKSAAFGSQDFEYVYSERDLNRKADVLVCFNGFPHRERNAPARGFRGLKVYHAFEYVFRAAEANRLFEEAGVDFLMGYTDHSRHCAFFRSTYPSYSNRVIAVPFGYGPRFVAQDMPKQRAQKVVALGAVNPVDDPTVDDRSALEEYKNFYRNETWTHRWRHLLREQAEQLGDVMDSFLPKLPFTNNPNYDAVEMMRKYAMFANDEGLMAFPPARTYEGTAAGAVMVSSNHECFLDLGFVDEVNCIMHRKHDIDDFRCKVGWYLENPRRLAEVAAASVHMVRSKFSHEQIANDLHKCIAAKLAK